MPQSEIDSFEENVLDYVRAQEAKKKADEAFNKVKDTFTDRANIFFENKGDDSPYPLEYFGRSILVSKIQKVTINWKPKILAKILGKRSDSVINKTYTINDMKGLISYLKKCDVDPNVFKSFINVEETVNAEELDKLEELGLIQKEQLTNCYSIKCQRPYYTVRVRRKDYAE